MSNPLLALVAAAGLVAGSTTDGEDWLREAQGRLYSWPEPASVVRFVVRTDVLDKTIANLRSQLPPNPTPDMVKSIDALRRIEITARVDTATGVATTEVDLPMQTSDPKRKEAVERMKEGIETMVSKSFEALPLSDPALFGGGRKVLEATEQGDALTVRVSGRGAAAGESTTIRLDRRRMLPDAFESPSMKMKVRYAEVLPGRFAPSFLDIQLPDSPRSTATFTYQRVGDIVFPATVVATLGEMSARLEFTSVRVEKRR